MPKIAIVLILSLLLFQSANAQSAKDTVIYCLNKYDQLVANKDSADYFMFSSVPINFTINSDK